MMKYKVGVFSSPADANNFLTHYNSDGKAINDVQMSTSSNNNGDVRITLLVKYDEYRKTRGKEKDEDLF